MNLGVPLLVEDLWLCVALTPSNKNDSLQNCSPYALMDSTVPPRVRNKPFPLQLGTFSKETGHFSCQVHLKDILIELKKCPHFSGNSGNVKIRSLQQFAKYQTLPS